MRAMMGAMYFAIWGVSWGCDGSSSTHSETFIESPRLERLSIDQCEPTEDVFPSPACTDIPRPAISIGQVSEAQREQVEEILVGRWTLCAGDVPLRSPASTEVPMGLQLSADRSWAVLYMRNGQPTASSHRDEVGTFSVVAGRSSFLVRFSTADFSTSSLLLLGCGPDQMILESGLYARGGGRGTALRVGVEPRMEACEMSGFEVDLPAEASEAMQALSGKWQACPDNASQGEIFWPGRSLNQNEFGFELQPSGDWWRLYLEDGEVVWGGHLGDVGAWTAGPGHRTEETWLDLSWFVDGISPDGSAVSVSGTVVLTENPRQLHWYNYSIETPMVFVSLDP